MPTRRRSGNTTASNPEYQMVANKKIKKNQQQDDEASLVETMMSRNQYSTGGTAINDSDLGDFGADEQDQMASGQKQSGLPGPKKEKLPPLVVKNVPQEKLACKISALGIDAEYKLARIGTKIKVHTRVDYNVISKLLKDSKVEFFTHDVAGEKPFKAVIRGLPNLDPKKIADEIKDRFKISPTAVYRMVRKDEQAKRYPDVLFLVHFQKGTVTLNALQAIRSLFSIIVRWESYRGGHRDVTQCQRCLQFGHGTRNCFVNHRCSNCAGKHASAECPMAGAVTEGTIAYKCANCGEGHQ
ncbi:unnamed protein product, partial [Brugia timori]|uniref:Nucleic-acid-binding protein from transposon X-element n=1 Tax=Brugia timori TaxID=42155 RepID=A0A0R3QIL5_9BILA